MPEILSDGNRDASAHLIFAHGAGAGMKSPWLVKFAGLLAGDAVCVHRFEFGYMAARTAGGSRRPPPKAESLMSEYAGVVGDLRKSLKSKQRLFVGGKSMGGRVASMIADDCYAQKQISGLLCIGYPFHPPEKPENLRTAHLKDLRCPSLIIQGTRDPFGTQEEVADYALSKQIAMQWIENGDHDLKGAGKGAMDRVAEIVRAYLTKA